jgi:hypothetical protein
MLSFFLSLFCALSATLVQQWSRTYIADVQRRGPPRLRGPVHSYLREGVERFGFNRAVDVIISLLHVSVLLFIAGFLEFLFNLDLVVARTILGLVTAAFAVYLILTVLPAIYPDCPYSTPLSPVVSFCVEAFARGARPIARSICYKTPRGSLWRRWSDHARVIFEFYCQCSRRYALSACNKDKSRQKPSHVFQQMVSSLDENDEIYEMMLNLPAYAKSLQQVGFDSQEDILPLMQQSSDPLEKLLASFGSQPNSDVVITPYHVQQLIQVMLLVNATGVQYGRLYIAVEPVSTPRVSECLNESASAPIYWLFLARHKDPAVSFISVSLLSSMFLVKRYWCSIDEARMDEKNLIVWRPHRRERQQPIDHLIWAIKPLPRHYQNIYRLLFFIRQILHYRTLPNTPIPSLEHIWSPILQGLHNLAFEADLRALPDGARSAIWRTIAVIGREDILPPHARGALPADALRLDYTAVFEEYPILGGTLRSVVTAILAPGETVDFEEMTWHLTPSTSAMSLPLPHDSRTAFHDRLASVTALALDTENEDAQNIDDEALELDERRGVPVSGNRAVCPEHDCASARVDRFRIEV